MCAGNVWIHVNCDRYEHAFFFDSQQVHIIPWPLWLIAFSLLWERMDGRAWGAFVGQGTCSSNSKFAYNFCSYHHCCRDALLGWQSSWIDHSFSFCFPSLHSLPSAPITLSHLPLFSFLKGKGTQRKCFHCIPAWHIAFSLFCQTHSSASVKDQDKPTVVVAVVWDLISLSEICPYNHNLHQRKRRKK